MLWYKAWLETRWRFLIGLAILVCSAAAVVLFYPRVMRELLPIATDMKTGGPLGRQIRDAAELMSTYRGYVWSAWFRQDAAQNWSICAALLGTGGLLSRASRGGTLYTLSMPVSRTQLLGVRAATALGELLVLAVVPSLVLPLLSPLVGQSYGVAPYGIAVPKSDGSLDQAILVALKDLQKNGQYISILKKWGVQSGADLKPVLNGAPS